MPNRRCASAKLVNVAGILLPSSLLTSTPPLAVLAWTTTPSSIAIHSSWWSYYAQEDSKFTTTSSSLLAQSPRSGAGTRKRNRPDDSNSGEGSKSQRNINNNNEDLAASFQQQAGSLSSNNMTAAYYAKHERLLQVRSQIDRLLQGPDPPFDMQAELQKVKSIAPPSPATYLQNLTDLQLEDRVMKLEHEIQMAIKQQDFERAVHAQQKIGQMHVDDCGAVLQVNAEYYKAFSNKDYQQMQAVWLIDGTATCIHPSQKALVGSKAVLASFDRMFASSSGAFQKSWMEPINIRISVKGTTTAVVTCDEHVFARRFIRGQKRQTELVNKLTATNIFRKVSGRWFLTHHHASWHADSQAAKQALTVRGQGGGVGGNKAENDSRTMSRSVLGASFDDKDDENDEDEDDEVHRLIEPDDDSENDCGMDGILGIQDFGPLLGDSKKKKEAVDDKKGKRVIMGSLSDILGGGLGDILGGAASSSKGNNGQPPQGKAIIRISQVNNGGSSNPGNMKWEEDEVMDFDDEEDEDDDELESLRPLCLSALRKLCDMGAISPRQKRVLITDIIKCSAANEFEQQASLVEIAYQLLVGGSSSPPSQSKHSSSSLLDVAMEEFADQCRVIAADLLEKEESSSSSSST